MARQVEVRYTIELTDEGGWSIRQHEILGIQIQNAAELNRLNGLSRKAVAHDFFDFIGRLLAQEEVRRPKLHLIKGGLRTYSGAIKPKGSKSRTVTRRPQEGHS